jgi:hypothetical protein
MNVPAGSCVGPAAHIRPRGAGVALRPRSRPARKPWGDEGSPATGEGGRAAGGQYPLPGTCVGG